MPRQAEVRGTVGEQRVNNFQQLPFDCASWNLMISAMATKPPVSIEVPSMHNWRTTDEDEVNRRRLRAQTEDFRIANADPRHPIFSNFRVKSGSGLTYSVEIRDVRQRQFGCDCVDFRINGLGTCKHVEAVLLHLQGRFRRLFEAAARNGTTRCDVVPDAASGSGRLLKNGGSLPTALAKWFDKEGELRGGVLEEAVGSLKKLAESHLPELRLSQELGPWLESRHRAAARKTPRREYELKVQNGDWPAQETKVPLFPYQREGRGHLGFTEGALRGEEM